LLVDGGVASIGLFENAAREKDRKPRKRLRFEIALFGEGDLGMSITAEGLSIIERHYRCCHEKLTLRVEILLKRRPAWRLLFECA
jgi:hypothetical protein